WQRIELIRAGLVEVDGAGGTRSRGAPRSGGSSRRLSLSRNVDLLAVGESRSQVELARGQAHVGFRAEAAGRHDGVRDPRAARQPLESGRGPGPTRRNAQPRVRP